VNKQESYPQYSVVVEWDPQDHIYVVSVPPGCMTHGATLKEAAEQAQDARGSWVDSARDRGYPLPAARIWTEDEA